MDNTQNYRIMLKHINNPDIFATIHDGESVALGSLVPESFKNVLEIIPKEKSAPYYVRGLHAHISTRLDKSVILSNVDMFTNSYVVRRGELFVRFGVGEFVLCDGDTISFGAPSIITISGVKVENPFTFVYYSNIQILDLKNTIKNHLSCPICYNCLAEPTLLSCGHMFCKDCIGLWRCQRNTCPVCRKVENDSGQRCFVVENIINDLYAIRDV